MVVDVRLAPMLLLDVSVWDVHVLQGGVVVLVSMGGQQMRPILSLMQVVRNVIMLVAMLQSLMLMMSLISGHARSPLYRSAASSR